MGIFGGKRTRLDNNQMFKNKNGTGKGKNPILLILVSDYSKNVHKNIYKMEITLFDGLE
jgi:hypothetical protein